MPQPKLTPPRGVREIGAVRTTLEPLLLDALARRVEQQAFADDEERAERMASVRNRVVDLLDSWRKVLEDHQQAGAELQYQRHELKQAKPLLREMLEEDFDSPHEAKFRANRSLRDVEPEVNLFLDDPYKPQSPGAA